jgi:hypothetical protein
MGYHWEANSTFYIRPIPTARNIAVECIPLLFSIIEVLSSNRATDTIYTRSLPSGACVPAGVREDIFEDTRKHLTEPLEH